MTSALPICADTVGQNGVSEWPLAYGDPCENAVDERFSDHKNTEGKLSHRDVIKSIDLK